MVKLIGTYETSILSADMYCFQVLPAHPSTKARLDLIQREETKLAKEELAEQAIAQSEIVTL